VGLTDASLWGELDRWERALGPCELWDDLRAGRAQHGGGAAEIEVAGAPAILARATPLPGGGLAVGFSRRDAPPGRALRAVPEAEVPAPSEAAPGRSRTAR
jgi:hypothetical protein